MSKSSNRGLKKNAPTSIQKVGAKGVITFISVA